MGQGKDLRKRTRRKKTDAEKYATKQKKNANAAVGIKGLSSFGFSAPNPHSDNESNTAGVNSSDDSSISNKNSAARADIDVVEFAEDVDDGLDRDEPEIVANLDIDDEIGDDLDDGINAEPDDYTPKKLAKRGVQHDYMRAVHDRLRCEVAGKVKGLEAKWLLEHLRANDWWITRAQASSVIRQLKCKNTSPSTHSDVTINPQHSSYYRSIKVWIPEEIWGPHCIPFCPTCKSDENVKKHGFNKTHIAREVVGLTENYFVMTRRYRCSCCLDKRREL